MTSVEMADTESGAVEHRPRARRRLPWRPVLHWAVVAAALGYLVWRVPDLAAQFERLDHVQWAWVAAAGLSGLAALGVYGELHRQLLLVGGAHVPASAVQGITFAQNAVSTTVPVVGGAGSLGYAINQLRRRGVDSALAAWAVLLAGVITTVLLIVLGWLGLAWAGRVPIRLAVPAALVVAAGSAGVWAVLTHPAVLQRGLTSLLRVFGRTPGTCRTCRKTWLEKADAAALQLSERVARLRPGGTRWSILLILALGSWGFDFFALIASAEGTGTHIRWAVLAVGFLVVQASIALQILPGGAGLAEAGLLGVLVAAGVPAAPAAATVLIYRAISWAGLSLVGWVVYALQPHATPSHRHAPAAPAAVARSRA
ncbi:lysylphosphatidylglycerol synthase transmembrane domain-containing protein [Amycolatopsis sp. FDAARGOS 1241]|uniref:lysylphosphatidylglycerol synthase transmembrane domain-containing protein n=1 Tax=Amycolatopsis sp. FDAARGOS 1241 TaxID=2778070 RepID=UPI0019513B8B|nr:lysylphosphatidylglycerol synthase transmembrane domain-containing protein [Amycolatopsis sp. FDAARGOS 1241]QRP48756.1 flippase-like domain-containing protein [Amycolatopsis sp. FDAARGOS 1241]